MPKLYPAEWSRLVGEFEALDAEAQAAYHAYEAAPADQRDALEARYEELGRLRNAHEDRLLEATAPSPEAAAYQLRLYALGHLFTDLAEPPGADEERAVAVLRHIYDGLRRLAVASAVPPIL
jgi:hypothetical protein